MRSRLDFALYSALTFVVLSVAAIPCTLGQAPSVATQKASTAAAKAGSAADAAQAGKQTLKGSAPSPPANLMAVESVRLLKLATELKAEIDKTNKDVLSIAVIRKANEIELMAHGMKDAIRAGTTGNSGEK